MQRFYTAHHPRNVNAGSRRSARVANDMADMADRIDGHEGCSYFLMEYCKFGDLLGQLRKAARDMPNGTERYLPESVLWLLFDCLVKACMAMEQPPMQNPASGPLPANAQGGFLPEVLTPGNLGSEGIVHMDLVSHHLVSPADIIQSFAVKFD